MCNILEWKGMKIIYKRSDSPILPFGIIFFSRCLNCLFGFCSYASLYFVIAIDNDDNELIALEIIHRFVETLDKYFGNVCELDVVFNFDKVLHEGSALYVLVHLSLFRSYSCLPSLVCMCVGIGILPPR